MHKLRIEVTKFTIVGGANFVLTFIVFTFMLKMMEVQYLISLATAWAIGIVFSYVLNLAWVFRPDQRIQFKSRFLKFFLAALLSLMMNMLALKYLVERTNMDAFFVQVLLIPFIVVFNFSTAKFWSLRQEVKD